MLSLSFWVILALAGNQLPPAGLIAVMTDHGTPHPPAVPRLALGDVDGLVPLVLGALELEGKA